ncbi:unknow [Vibrio campbellii]|nr:unknow [Vibrio campbellii]
MAYDIVVLSEQFIVTVFSDSAKCIIAISDNTFEIGSGDQFVRISYESFLSFIGS